MLMHEENENIQNPNVSAAARARVTPQELARAAAALEAKREAERQQHQDTIPLGEAVQQLGMNITAEELLAEVEAARLAQTPAAAGNNSHSTSQVVSDRQALGIGIASLGGLIIGILLPALGFYIQSRLELPRKPSSTLAMMPLAQVADGQPVHCDHLTLSRLASGTAEPAKVLVDARSEADNRTSGGAAFGKEWTLVKRGGTYLVRAWATADQILRSSNEQSAAVFSNRPPWLPAATLMTVDLPLYRFQEISDSAFSTHDRDGKEVSEAAGVVQEFDAHGVDELVNNAIQHSDVTNSVEHTGINYRPDVSVSVASGVIQLTGYVYSEAAKQDASRVAEETLRKYGLTDRVSNGITVQKL